MNADTILDDAMFRALADSIDHIVWSTRADGTFDYANHRWTEYTGIAPDAQARKWLDLLHDNDRERVAKLWSDSVATGIPFSTEYRLRRHDGTHRWFLSRGGPSRDADGRIVRWFGTCTDIHDVRLVGSMAHDFNNLLTVIKGHAEFLSRSLPDEGVMREDIDQIVNTAQRAVVLVRQLLAFNRQEATLHSLSASSDGSLNPSPEPWAVGHELVLLVDDEDQVRAIACRILKTHGYKVIEARDGLDALSKLDGLGRGIDILVTDVIMPRMNGIELTRQLRAKQPDIPVVVVSGHTDEQLNSHKISALGVTFIPKPFAVEGLLRAVRCALDKK